MKKMKREKIIEICKIKGMGIAFAEILESAEHFHKKTKEIYYVLEGKGNIFINGKKFSLKEEIIIKIMPKARHFVKSRKGIKILVISMPSWNEKDHFFVQK